MRIVISRKLLPLALLLFVTLACSLLPNLKKELDRAANPIVLTSRDRKFQITVPGGWREDRELNEQADLTASNRLQELYIVILNETKEDYSDDSTLENFTWSKRESGMNWVTSQVTSEPTPTVINGYQAMQYELQGVVDHLKIGYIITTIETPGYYHHLIAWTLQSRFDANKGILHEVTRSFKETGTAKPPAGQPPPPAPTASTR